MTFKALPYPVFDADNHLYETEESLTKYLPQRYRDAVQYVQVNGRTKIAVRGVISTRHHVVKDLPRHGSRQLLRLLFQGLAGG